MSQTQDTTDQKPPETGGLEVQPQEAVEPPASAVEAVQPTGLAAQDAILREAGIVLPGDQRVWLVEIRGSLLGRRHVLAATEGEACEKYKRPCGITSHTTPVTAMVTELDPANLPEGVELFGE